MKLLKILHALFGILALALILALANGLLQLTANPTNLNSPEVLILLACALCSLSLGSTAFSYKKSHSLIQALASVFVLVSGTLAILATYQPQQQLAGYPLSLIATFLLITGVLLHFLLSLSIPAPPISLDNTGREMGTVKWFNVTKGFGFITRDIGDDVFVHYRAIRGEGHRTLTEGQRVEFVVVDKDKGLQAEDVIAAPRGR